MRKELQQELEIITDRGYLTAKVNNDPNYPGIKIYLGHVLITTVECANDEIRTVVYADSEEEDYTDLITIN